MRLRPLLIGAAVSAALVAGFWELAEDFASSLAVMRLDVTFSSAVTSLRTPWLTSVMGMVTALGGTIVVAVAAVSLVVRHLSLGRRLDAVFLAAVVAGGALLSTVAKGRFARPRPLENGAVVLMPDSFSFPSGHSMASLCLASALIFAVVHSEMSRRHKILSIAGCVLYVLGVGFSRVYLGVHFSSDVLASWLLGGALIALATGVVLSLRSDIDPS